MGAPVLIPAAIGAVGSAAMGKSPLLGAAMGGALGGLGSASGLFGAGATGAGATTVTSPASLFGGAESLAGGGAGNLGMFTAGNIGSTGVGPAAALGSAGEYASAVPSTWMGQKGMMDVSTGSVLGGQGIPVMSSGGYDTSLLGSVQRGLESGYGSLSDWAKANPMQALSTTGQMVQAVSPQEQAQQMMQPSIPPITKGVYNAAPTLGQGQNEKVATRMQITPNQLQVYPNFYFRGGY